MPIKNLAESGFVHFILVIFIAVVGVGALGCYSFKNKEIKISPAENKPSLTRFSTATITPTKTTDIYENWETYKNEKYSFSLRHPQGLAVKQIATSPYEQYQLVFAGKKQEESGSTPTHFIRHLAPKTWKYLEKHSSYFEKRKSEIYKDAPRFSIFGVGSYIFAPWKIAICGLYKNLDFRLIGKSEGKPIVFDDTICFLSFNNKEEASQIHELLMSSNAQDFLSSLIFWDEKRPIKTSILNNLNLDELGGKQILRLFEKKNKITGLSYVLPICHLIKQ